MSAIERSAVFSLAEKNVGAKATSENYDRVVAALERLGFRFVRQRGSHIRLERTLPDRTIRITVPAHRPVKRSTLSHILKQGEVSLDEL